MSSYFDGDESLFQGLQAGIYGRLPRTRYEIVGSFPSDPEPTARSAPKYPNKEPGKSLPFELPPGDEDFNLLFSRGDTPPLSETEGDPAKVRLVRLKEQIKQLGRDFNLKAWMGRLSDLIEKLVKGATPGSYRHFLLLLFEPDETFTKVQRQMRMSFYNTHSRPSVRNIAGYRPSAAWSADKLQLLNEVELLRDLVEPLRDGGETIHWLDKDLISNINKLKSLKKAYMAIFNFELEIKSHSTLLDGKNEFSFTEHNGNFRKTTMSMRLIRMNICRRSFVRMLKPQIPRFYMGPPNPAKEDRFGHHKKGVERRGGNDKDQVGKARSSSSQQNKPEAENRIGTMNDVIDHMMNTARWLAQARCVEAVDLFCDVARRFSSHDLPAKLSEEKFFLVRAICNVMFDLDDIIGRYPTSNEGSNDEDILNSLNQAYTPGADELRLSVQADKNFRSATAFPAAPGQIRGYRPRSSRPVRDWKKEEAALRKRARLEKSRPRFYKLCHEPALPTDPSNWAANQTSPFSVAYTEELDATEERVVYQELKSKPERDEHNYSHSRTAPYQPNVEPEVGKGQGPITGSKPKRADLAPNCTPRQARAMIFEELRRGRNDTSPSVYQEELDEVEILCEL
ncbi:hypothetical protein PABG_01423 [Paracoccidioides brasiliensis Pb03]|nr:hypothetical protein PABG_01423 [Paracoccidioides brasiliensis Pb03]